jgi:hypothetical protein
LLSGGASTITDEGSTARSSGSVATSAIDATADAAANASNEAAGSRNQSAMAAAPTSGRSTECQCPPVETEADAAAAQAYGRDYFAICLPVKVHINMPGRAVLLLLSE